MSLPLILSNPPRRSNVSKSTTFSNTNLVAEYPKNSTAGLKIKTTIPNTKVGLEPPKVIPEPIITPEKPFPTTDPSTIGLTPTPTANTQWMTNTNPSVSSPNSQWMTNTNPIVSNSPQWKGISYTPPPVTPSLSPPPLSSPSLSPPPTVEVVLPTPSSPRQPSLSPSSPRQTPVQQPVQPSPSSPRQTPVVQPVVQPAQQPVQSVQQTPPSPKQITPTMPTAQTMPMSPQVPLPSVQAKSIPSPQSMKITDFTFSQPEKELSISKEMMSSNVRSPYVEMQPPELPKPTFSPGSASSEKSSMSSVKSNPEMLNINDDGRKILASTGYTVIGSVSVKHKDGTQTLFMRALNPIGCIVLVRMDSGSHVVTNPADLSMIESVESSSLDRATMSGIYNSVNPFVKGAAVQCKSGFCVIETSMQDSTEFVQHNYQNADAVQIGKAYSEEWMTDSNKMIVYPIVSLKDIQTDPVRTLQYTDIACVNIRNQATRRGEMDIKHFDQEYQRMSDICKATVSQYKTLRTSLMADLEIRRTNARRTVSIDRSRMDSRSRESLERDYNSNMNAMRREEELLMEMNKIARTVGDLSIDFQSLSEKMIALSKIMSNIII